MTTITEQRPAVPFHINKIVKEKQKRSRYSRMRLADRTCINYKSLSDKMTFDRFKAYDLLLVAKVLDIDLNALRDQIELN